MVNDANPAETNPNDPSLYQRLGGVYAIATVVDDFVDRIMVDTRLNANPKVDEAHHRVPPAGFKYLVTEQVCQAVTMPNQPLQTDRRFAPAAERQTRYLPEVTSTSGSK